MKVGARATAIVPAMVLLSLLAACGGAVPSATSSEVPTVSERSTVHPSPAASPIDLAAVLFSSDAPPSGMTPDGGRDGQVLNRLPLSQDRSAALQAQPGFVSGSYSTFSGPAGFLLTWAAQYASDDQAAGALSIVLDEMQSDDGYGWGLGDDAGLGDEGTCLEGDNPQEGGLHETICAWRNGSLVLVVGGDSTETPIPSLAEDMDSRAEGLGR